MQWFIGCSGFYYKEWKEWFYPKGWPQKQWFEYYCQHFNTLEINNTFYRFPEVSTLQSWALRSPEHFTFSIKVPRIITHLNKFTGTEDLVQNFYGVVKEGLQHKTGPVLFQLPASVTYSLHFLELMLSQMDASFQNVIEFRHQSWWQPEVYDKLQKHNVTFCSVSFPKLPDEVIATIPVTYYRFHGVPKLYYSSYHKDFLSKVVEKIKAEPKGEKAFLYFNNTAARAALENAKFVQSLT